MKFAKIALVLALAATGIPGCQRSLFMGSQTATRHTIDTYWDGDSAVETRAARERSSEYGFGLPMGMNNQ